MKRTTRNVSVSGGGGGAPGKLQEEEPRAVAFLMEVVPTKTMH